MFVVDDGWYADKDIGRKCKIGDWYADKGKFPKGLSGTVQKINDLGLDFGLWIEPEMVGVDSEIYRKHPDWIIHTKDRQRHIVHGRFVLDLAKEEVCQHIMDTFDRLLSEVPIKYIKWDCNRSMVDKSSPVQAHQYILGLYKILEYLNTKYPELLIENCSAGGGRYDPGNMYYMHQAQISDNTHASDKIWMTYGTQLVYPPSYITSKIGSDDYKDGLMQLAAAVGMSGIFGCEFDMSLLNTEDMGSLKEILAYYRSIQELVQKGELYRISSPVESDIVAWQYVAEDKKRAIVFIYRTKRAFSRWNDVLRLKGLDRKQVYGVTIRSDMTYRTKELEMSGQLLETVGVRIAGSQKDFSYAIFELTAKSLSE